MHGQYIIHDPDSPHLVLFATPTLEEAAAALAAQPRAGDLTISVNRDGFSRSLDADEANRLGSLLGSD
jgi:hypothetical protein